MCAMTQSSDHTGGDDPTEVFDLIDAQDRVIGRVLRGDAHRNPSLWHRSVQVLIFATDDRLLLQRRSDTKDLFPGYYCASASGHVAAGDGYDETADREVREELGLSLKLSYIGKRLVKSPMETEMTTLYLGRSDGPFRFHPTETAGGDFLPVPEIMRRRTDGSLPMTPALLCALDMLAELQRTGALMSLLAAL